MERNETADETWSGERGVALLDYQRLDRLADELRDRFATAQPYPHVVIDDFLPESVAEDLLEEFEKTEQDWKHYHHYNERKLALTDLEQMPPRTRELFSELQDQRMLDFAMKLSGLRDLISDPDLEGAGMHMVTRGGFLNVHTDFLTHTKRRNWSRRINLILYLNKDWQEEWNGNLELWDDDLKHCVQSVAPAFNRCVIFNTLEKSYHGHPHKLCCPPDLNRKSLLLYYYRDEGHELKLSSTNYRPLPQDSWLRRWMIAGDRVLLRLYTLVKGHTKISDRLMDRILRRL
jgi:Rps23 Pro-64 3,4-dihydroxylase Tpa1-like proline 4-hydroxylase